MYFVSRKSLIYEKDIAPPYYLFSIAELYTISKLKCPRFIPVPPLPSIPLSGGYRGSYNHGHAGA